MTWAWRWNTRCPQTVKRIDVLLTGADGSGRPKLVIIELKQWSEARFSEKDGIIWAYRGGRVAETEGPQPGLFVAQMLGESMNKRIPNGVVLVPGRPATVRAYRDRAC